MHKILIWFKVYWQFICQAVSLRLTYDSVGLLLKFFLKKERFTVSLFSLKISTQRMKLWVGKDMVRWGQFMEATGNIQQYKIFTKRKTLKNCLKKNNKQTKTFVMMRANAQAESPPPKKTGKFLFSAMLLNVMWEESSPKTHLVSEASVKKEPNNGLYSFLRSSGSYGWRRQMSKPSPWSEPFHSRPPWRCAHHWVVGRNEKKINTEPCRVT